jgi:hypothetical protein
VDGQLRAGGLKSFDVAQARLSNQFLGKRKCNTPCEVVASLGAVQAQDFAAAKWALGLRMHKATDSDIEQAFNDGATGYGEFLEKPSAVS